MSRFRGGGARATLALAVIAVSLWTASSAFAQESPTPTADPSATATPSATPSAAPSPSPTDSPSPSPSGSVTPSPSGTQTPSPSGSPSASPGPSNGPHSTVHPAHGLNLRTPNARREQRRRQEERRERRRWKDWRPSTDGAWSTRRLVVAAQQARRKGWSTDRIAHRIYAPFPVMGPASWVDSWGAPRWAGGYHPHAGQDVMCVYGAPILAVQRGVVTFGHNGLGGDVAYLTRPDGSFWYYAHLSSQAASRDGATVEQGDIIGHCGTSGDASVPHLHFGFEAADGTMLDPLRPLLVMLHEAKSSLDAAADHEDARVPRPDPSTALPNLAPWPRHPIPTEEAAVAVAPPHIPVAAGVLIAVGVLGPLGFLYRRSRQLEPRGTSRSVS